MIKDSNENIYCDIKVKIFRFLNKFLHEPLFLELVIVIFFSAIGIYEYCMQNYPRILCHMTLMSENRRNIQLLMFLVTLFVLEF